MDPILKKYSDECKKIAKVSVSTEDSFYDVIKELINNGFDKYDIVHKNNYIVIVNPYNKHGKPDIFIKYNYIPIAIVEVKVPEADIYDYMDPSNTEKEAVRCRKQMERYKHDANIVFLSNVKSLYLIEDLKIVREFNILKDDFTLHPSAEKDFEGFISLITSGKDTLISSLDTLIKTMSNVSINLRDALIKVMNPKKTEYTKYKKIRAMIEELSKFLYETNLNMMELSDVKKEMPNFIAQIITYTNLIAWINHIKDNKGKYVPYNIGLCSRYIPTDSFIYKIYRMIIDSMNKEFQEAYIDPITNILNNTDTIVANNMDELINTFYSDFLKKYNENEYKARGVIYTPSPIVDFMVRSVDIILQDKFGIEDGIISDDVTFLDPATGTGAYITSILEHSCQKISNKYVDLGIIKTISDLHKEYTEMFKKSFLRDNSNIMNGRVYAFEILPAPYTLATLRLFTKAERMGIEIDYENYVPNIFLINTLMDPNSVSTLTKFSFGDEIKGGLKIRKERDIRVIIGNPPYSVKSMNNNDVINEMTSEYISDEYIDDIEKSSFSSMKDDYIKFIRIAEEKIKTEPNGGILTYITNNFYIHGLSARGMRKHLKETFDEIYIIDLHGNWRKKVSSDDENVFDVNVGIAISFMIKYPENKHNEHKRDNPFLCDVYYCSIKGSKTDKFMILDTNDINSINFTKVESNFFDVFYPITPVHIDYENEYVPINKIFNYTLGGFVTKHDSEVISFTYDESKTKVDLLFLKYDPKTRMKKENNKKSWKPRVLSSINGGKTLVKTKIRKIMYYSFDYRYAPLMSETTSISKNMLTLVEKTDNLFMGFNKSRIRSPMDGIYAIISNYLIGDKAIEHPVGLHTHFAPLYYYDESKRTYSINITEYFIKLLPFDVSDKSDVFFYVYAILYSSVYNKRYVEYLKIGYPRIPIPTNKEVFDTFVSSGRKLAEIQLFREPSLKEDMGIEHNLRTIEPYVIDPEYDPKRNVIMFNKKDPDGKESVIIKNIPNEVWEFKIGGFRILEEWLKVRRYKPNIDIMKDIKHRNSSLSSEEINYFISLIKVIMKTIEIVKEIDKNFEKYFIK